MDELPPNQKIIIITITILNPCFQFFYFHSKNFPRAVHKCRMSQEKIQDIRAMILVSLTIVIMHILRYYL